MSVRQRYTMAVSYSYSYSYSYSFSVALPSVVRRLIVPFPLAFGNLKNWDQWTMPCTMGLYSRSFMTRLRRPPDGSEARGLYKTCGSGDDIRNAPSKARGSSVMISPVVEASTVKDAPMGRFLRMVVEVALVVDENI
jgi:hypothetical protein